MKAAWILFLCLCATPAQAASCSATASTPEAFDKCARQEILPLETRRVHAMAALRTKYRGNPELLKLLESSEDSWNAYRNAYCGAEAAARGGSDVERRRAYGACAKRALKQHVRDLESL